MRAVLQRVDTACVSVDNRIVSMIGRGILVFLGIEKGDGPHDATYLLDKVINLRIFEDAEGKMNLSLLDVSGEMLVISQFTLLADCRKGRRPSFTQAEEPGAARELYELFLAMGRERLGTTAGGEFQAIMKIDLINDGPVTIILDTKNAL